ncbi:DUF4190 domain-containing protein [bacterium]|jgi:hypothetical protein|nr:DUF4190 domain-containing protein [bacterium]MBT4251215.1 DUF4190 domain-containing protein [bacterium]MBT4597993.1 DUF4190 domain-containing protein [bacterium]MBT6753594.1 DUF4190 domain-containing protein [bacterium]MBT7037709.1 DUF4190 domain-containing protein [bacterium]
MENQNQTGEEEALAKPRSEDFLDSNKKLPQSTSHQDDGKKNVAFKQKTHKDLHAENAEFQQTMHSQNAKQAYYIPDGVPDELVEDLSGSKARSKGIISIVCAVISLVFFPPVFGFIGVSFGVKARKLGAKTLGSVGIILSSVFMGVGIALSSWYFNSEKASGEELIGGTVGLFLKLF